MLTSLLAVCENVFVVANTNRHVIITDLKSDFIYLIFTPFFFN
jgi:hypothetical protein